MTAPQEPEEGDTVTLRDDGRWQAASRSGYVGLFETREAALAWLAPQESPRQHVHLHPCYYQSCCGERGPLCVGPLCPQEPAHVPVSGPDTPRPVGADPAKCRRVCVACNASQHESCGWASCHPDRPVSQGAGSGSEALRARLLDALGGLYGGVIDHLLPLIEADREAYASEREEKALRDAAEEVERNRPSGGMPTTWRAGHTRSTLSAVRILTDRADAVRDAREGT